MFMNTNNTNNFDEIMVIKDILGKTEKKYHCPINYHKLCQNDFTMNTHHGVGDKNIKIMSDSVRSFNSKFLEKEMWLILKNKLS
jgi:hypothetical protein